MSGMRIRTKRRAALGAASLLACVLAIGAVVVSSACADALSAKAVYKGEVSNVESSSLTIKDVAGISHRFEVAEDAKITKDGKTVKLAVLKEGDTCTVTAEKKDGKSVAMMITALSKA